MPAKPIWMGHSCFKIRFDSSFTILASTDLVSFGRGFAWTSLQEPPHPQCHPRGDTGGGDVITFTPSGLLMGLTSSLPMFPVLLEPWLGGGSNRRSMHGCEPLEEPAIFKFYASIMDYEEPWGSIPICRSFVSTWYYVCFRNFLEFHWIHSSLSQKCSYWLQHNPPKHDGSTLTLNQSGQFQHRAILSESFRPNK